MKTMADANEKAFQSELSHHSVPGPAGVERFVVSRISVDREYLGSVVAYCFLDKQMTPALISQSKQTLGAFGLDESTYSDALSHLKVLGEQQKKYFFELVDLVSQEIDTFHTEISRREERISALSNQLGTRYSYDSMIGKSKPMQDVYSLLDKIKNFSLV
jgi:response regulator RpfG family c-di-GMP phosphodiesterase